MSQRNDEPNEKSLDTKLMQEKLKGDIFPENWDEFLDDSIKIFFDELLNKTGAKEKRNHPRRQPFARIRLPADGRPQARQARLLSFDRHRHVPRP